MGLVSYLGLQMVLPVTPAIIIASAAGLLNFPLAVEGVDASIERLYSFLFGSAQPDLMQQLHPKVNKVVKSIEWLVLATMFGIPYQTGKDLGISPYLTAFACATMTALAEDAMVHSKGKIFAGVLSRWGTREEQAIVACSGELQDFIKVVGDSTAEAYGTFLLGRPPEQQEGLIPGGGSSPIELAAFVIHRNLRNLGEEEQDSFFAGEPDPMEKVLHGVPPELRLSLFQEQGLSAQSVLTFLLQSSPLSPLTRVVDAFVAAAAAYGAAYDQYVSAEAGRHQFELRKDLKTMFANYPKLGFLASFFRTSPAKKLLSDGRADLKTRGLKWMRKIRTGQLVSDPLASSTEDAIHAKTEEYVGAFDAPGHRDLLRRTDIFARLMAFQDAARAAFKKGQTLPELRALLQGHGVGQERVDGRLKNVHVHMKDPGYFV